MSPDPITKIPFHMERGLCVLEFRKAKKLLHADHHGVAEFAQGLVLDLADALTSEADALADLLEGHGIFPVEPVAELEDSRFALVDLAEQLAQLAKLVAIADELIRAGVVR